MSRQNSITGMQQHNLQPLPPEVSAKIVENHSKELGLRLRELDVREKADKHQAEYNHSFLGAQARELESTRESVIKREKNMYIFTGTIILCLLLFVITSFYFKQSQMAYDIVKSVLFFGGGILVGRSGRKNYADKAQ